jgi:hypothetical protein
MEKMFIVLKGSGYFFLFLLWSLHNSMRLLFIATLLAASSGQPVTDPCASWLLGTFGGLNSSSG